ncbi:hypothetical protein ACS0TY_021461 [Phlomoides rotata]
MNLNSSPSPFPMHQDNDHHYLPFGPNQSSCHFFFNSTQDNTGSFYDHHQFNFQPQHKSDENYDYQGGSTYEMKNKVDSGLKLSLWKEEDGEGHNSNYKWMSSKMRVMQKMKNDSWETDQMSSNSCSYNNNSPIRVCADCNTTKTPLWRSGPKGPKSLCNACGIRQRKARRAMAAAAANGPPAAAVKIKEKKKGHSSQLKKRYKMAVGGTAGVGSAAASNGQLKKSGFEDFLIKISNNLAFHRVFPEDEKDAAILLMALSSGLVNG